MLTEAEVETYHREGYVIPQGFRLPVGALADLHTALDAVLADNPDSPPDRLVNVHLNCGKPYGIKWAPPLEEQSMKGSTRRNDPDADRERHHPAVLVHPVTGRKGLYINPTYTLRLEGMNEEESRPILNQLFAHCALPEHCLRLQWRPGMLVIWDNYATQHYAINDYHGFRREMRRATFQGPGLDAWRG